MPDDKTKKIPLDASRVNVNQSYEVAYWTNKFGCTKSELENAVKKVGTSAEKVKGFLKNN
jgi:hypothetical protein